MIVVKNAHLSKLLLFFNKNSNCSNRFEPRLDIQGEEIMKSTGPEEKIITITHQNGQEAGRSSQWSDHEVDFSMFGAREIRDILKSKAHCLQAGFSANHVIIKTLNEIRSHYIHRVGLATYLSQMLGPVANAQLQYCTLYDERGREIELHLNGNRNVPLQRFIAKHFTWNNLPAMIEVQVQSGSNRVEVRYL